MAVKIYIPATSKLVYVDKGTITPVPYSPFDLRIIPDYTSGSVSVMTKRGDELFSVPFADVKVEAGTAAGASLAAVVLYLATLIE